MTKKEFDKKLAEIKAQEEKFGVRIDFDYIDRNHLNCLWYGGEVGQIETADGYVISIAAYGDIRMGGMYKGEELDFKDTGNAGSLYSYIGDKINDLENNNWFEFDIIPPEGKFIDCSAYDNILDDDLLDCFSDIDYYLEILEEIKEERKVS